MLFNMFYLLKVFFKDPWVVLPLLVSAISQIYMWPYILMNLAQRKGTLFLHYNVVFGVDLVGAWWKIFFLPLAGLIIIVLNFGAALYSRNSDKVISRMFTVFAAVFQLFLVLAVYLTVQINL